METSEFITLFEFDWDFNFDDWPEIEWQDFDIPEWSEFY